MAQTATTTELLRDALSACLPYMEGLEADNQHDPSVGIYQDHELTDALNLAKEALKEDESAKAWERRLFSAMTLQGALSNQQLLINLEGVYGGTEAWAVRCADSLLFELSK